MSVLVVHNLKSLTAGFISFYDSDKNTVHFLKTLLGNITSLDKKYVLMEELPFTGAFSNMTLRVQPVWG